MAKEATQKKRKEKEKEKGPGVALMADDESASSIQGKGST